VIAAPSFIGYGKKILENNFEGETGFTATGGLKDAQHIRRLAMENGATVPALDVVRFLLIFFCLSPFLSKISQS
jgi:hypothetical protein